MEEKIKIKISISEKLLKDIEQNIEGKTRNAKLINCVELGIQAFSEEISESE